MERLQKIIARSGRYSRRQAEESIAQGKVIDVGSGPGKDALMIKNEGLDIVCLDASRAMIELSKAKGLVSEPSHHMSFVTDGDVHTITLLVQPRD